MFRGTDYLSSLADALLSTVERDRNAPHYGESVFARKMRLAQRRDRTVRPTQGPSQCPYLLRVECLEVFQAAQLTDAQSEVLLLRLEGRTWEEIGQLRGHTKQGAQRIFTQASRKLRRAWVEYPYRGLPRVYEDEVKRRCRSGYRSR